jgi:hypothetical protein
MGSKLGAIGSIGGGIAGGVFGGPAGAAAGSSIGGALGNMAAGDPNKKANAAQLEAMRRLQAAYGEQVQLNPEDYVADYTEIDPEALKYYTPELEAAQQLGDTQIAGISTDPAFKSAQMEALSRLQQRAGQGLTLEEEAARNQISRELETTGRGQQDAILQQMARRGTLGSGAELAARMASAQGGYSEAARQGEALAAQRDKRALQAALESGNLGTSLRDQEYGEQAKLAAARDAIEQFNLNQRANVQQRNVGSKNTAAKNTADLRNQAYLTNVGQKNTQAEQRVSGLKDTTASRNAALLGGAQAGTNTANTAQQQGAASAARKAGNLEGLVQGGLGAYGAFTANKAPGAATGPQFKAEDVKTDGAEYYDSATNTFKKGMLT